MRITSMNFKNKKRIKLRCKLMRKSVHFSDKTFTDFTDKRTTFVSEPIEILVLKKIKAARKWEHFVQKHKESKIGWIYAPET